MKEINQKLSELRRTSEKMENVFEYLTVILAILTVLSLIVCTVTPCSAMIIITCVLFMSSIVIPFMIVEPILDNKNREIKDLEYELRQLEKQSKTL